LLQIVKYVTRLLGSYSTVVINCCVVVGLSSRPQLSTAAAASHSSMPSTTHQVVDDHFNNISILNQTCASALGDGLECLVFVGRVHSLGQIFVISEQRGVKHGAVPKLNQEILLKITN